MTAAAEARVSALARALRVSGQPDALDLATRLLKCQQGRADRRAGHRPAWPTRCRTPACEFCRLALIDRTRARTAAHFTGTRPEDCFFATVAVARCGGLADVRKLVRSLRTALRNLRSRHARINRRWDSLTMAGVVEVDACGPSDIVLLPPARRAVVGSLPAYGGIDYATHGCQVVWLPHVHVAIHAPNLNFAELVDALGQQWPGPGRVDVQPFRAGDPRANAGGIASYALKHEMVTKLDGGRDYIKVEWPIAVRGTYWTWLHGLRSGLSPLRLFLGPTRSTQ